MDSLQISVDGNHEVAVVCLRGRLGIETSPDLRVHLLSMLNRQNPPAAIAIDLTLVSYMNTAGMATLIEGLKFARVAGIAMHLQGLQGRLLQLFQATGIGSLFETARPADNSSTSMES